MFNSFRTASTKFQKLFSRGPRSERLGSSALTGINIFKPLWMQQICMCGKSAEEISVIFPLTRLWKSMEISGKRTSCEGVNAFFGK